jgi:hypothetical protein
LEVGKRLPSSGSLQSIKRDFTGRADLDFVPLFGKEFSSIFRISLARFQRLMEDVMAANIPFYQPKKNQSPTNQASLEAKLLLPLQCLAFGLPVVAITRYFQMSPTMATSCCNDFDITIKQLYEEKYLRLPTPNDLKAIVNLHKDVHGVDGMSNSFFSPYLS